MTVLIGFMVPAALLAFRLGAAVISYRTGNVLSVARAVAARATARKNVFRIMNEISLAASPLPGLLKVVGYSGHALEVREPAASVGICRRGKHCYTSLAHKDHLWEYGDVAGDGVKSKCTWIRPSSLRLWDTDAARL